MDTILTLPLELMLLTLVVGGGILYALRTRTSVETTIDTLAPLATRPHDMRFDGQLLPG